MLMEIKMDPLIIMALVFSLPIGWLFYLLKTANKRIDDMQQKYYDKLETDKMIMLHLQPVLQSVQQVKDDTSEIKHLIGKLFDGQSKK